MIGMACLNVARNYRFLGLTDIFGHAVREHTSVDDRVACGDLSDDGGLSVERLVADSLQSSTGRFHLVDLALACGPVNGVRDRGFRKRGRSSGR